MKIDILLATYNGESFLENQILSIIMQTHHDWRLIIHDDGSTDNTVKIIKKYESADSRIVFINDNVTKLGPAGNFMHLLNFASSEFVCFCDQDDIWLENKLEFQLKRIQQFDNTRPQVVFCNKYIWKDGKISAFKLRDYYNFKEILFQNGGAQGCCSIFNSGMLSLLKAQKYYVAMHDHLLTMCAILVGGIHYQDEALILYRRHTENVTQLDRSNISRIFSPSPIIDNNYYKGVRSFYENNMPNLSRSHTKLFGDYISFNQSSKWKKIIILLNDGFSIRKSKTRLFFKLIISFIPRFSK